GLLVGTDPTFFFLSLHEWGPFTTLFLCRAGGFALLLRGWQTRKPLFWVLGGLALGLGVYARADFVVIPAAVLLAALCARPEIVSELRERWREAALALAAATLGALPMLVSLGGIWTTSGGVGHRGGFGEKWSVLLSTLDGSHFYRLMEAGGRFDRMFTLDAPHTGFPVVLAVAVVVASAAVAGRYLARERLSALVFAGLAMVLIGACMLVIPGAVRAHHQLNALPFPQLLLALCVVALWGAGAGRAWRWATRALAAGLVAAVVVGNGWVLMRTLAVVDETGGRGWWSRSLSDFAGELTPEDRVVSLDWGLHEPILFVSQAGRAIEPIWRIPRDLRRRGAWTYSGSVRDVYLSHEEEYDLFGYGPDFLRAARALPSDGVEIREHRDARGEVAFVSVRFGSPHRIAYDGSFRIQLRTPPP
ncbi:MAG: hypothetical protein MJE66_13425, partial [Proteobacteria bacterium]|nr:hypothetical protein [Pseudomonadota bacterium]